MKLAIVAKMIHHILSAEDPKAAAKEIITNLDTPLDFVGYKEKPHTLPISQIPLLRLYEHWFRPDIRKPLETNDPLR
jgi:hypothetical protein